MVHHVPDVECACTRTNVRLFATNRTLLLRSWVDCVISILSTIRSVDGVGVAVGVRVGVRVAVLVAVRVGVFVVVGVAVLVTVFVEVAVFVGVLVGVDEYRGSGVLLGVLVKVGVASLVHGNIITSSMLSTIPRPVYSTVTLEMTWTARLLPTSLAWKSTNVVCPIGTETPSVLQSALPTES